MTTIYPLQQWKPCIWDQPWNYISREYVFSRVMEHALQFYPTTTTFSDTCSLTSGKHLFYKEVLEHLQFHS